MRHVARILFQNGALIFNTGAPYDYQVVFDHADRYARLQGAITLDLEGVTWTVNATGAGAPCGACGERLHRLSYARPDLVLCRRCARSTRLVLLRPRGPHPPTRKPPRKKDGRAPESPQQRLPDAEM